MISKITSDIKSEAKNYLNRELGNHQRFLYEYGYHQIVDILAEGGFLCKPPKEHSNDQ